MNWGDHTENGRGQTPPAVLRKQRIFEKASKRPATSPESAAPEPAGFLRRRTVIISLNGRRDAKTCACAAS